ncbi:MAG: hypothetical protein AAGJ89_11275 [Pseudomonadota bacterium]
MLYRNLLIGMLGLCVAGCETVSPVGVIVASQLDPLETNPSDIAVAVRVPKKLILREGDATLALSYLPDDRFSFAAITAEVPLSVTSEDWPYEIDSDAVTYVLAFSETDGANLQQTQAKIKALRASGIEGKGTLAINVEGGCFTGPLEGQLIVATWIRTNPTAGFVQLTRPTDIFGTLSAEELAALQMEFTEC